MKRFLFFLSGVAVAIVSCDKIDNNPYIYTNGNNPNPSDTTVRKALIEDYTGHNCSSCPNAALTAQTIQNNKEDIVVVMAVHAGGFAAPTTPPLTYDFRTNEGDAYNTVFNPPSNPNGMINRRNYPLNHWGTHYTKWADSVNAILALPPDVDIKITNSYNPTTKVLNTSVRCKFLNSLNGAYNLVVLLTEDSIIKPQKMPNLTIKPDYVHRHVLRDGITSGWGDLLKSGTISAGDSIVKPYQYTLPGAFPAVNGITPVPSQCYVIAFVYDAGTGSPTYYEILQVEEEKFY